MSGKPLKERFEEKIEMIPECGCWIWTGGCTHGYGYLWIGNQYRRAHRISWEIYRGDIPKGLCVLHRCDVRSCVNPNHLFLGTEKENIQDCINKNRWHIQSGMKHGQAKLTDSDVLLIRSDNRTQEEIGRDFGVTRSLVSMIKNRKIWRHI